MIVETVHCLICCGELRIITFESGRTIEVCGCDEESRGFKDAVSALETICIEKGAPITPEQHVLALEEFWLSRTGVSPWACCEEAS